MLGKSGTQKLRSVWPQRIAKIILWSLIIFLILRGIGSILKQDPAATIKDTLTELENNKNYTYITEKEAEAFAVMFSKEYMTYNGNNDDYTKRLQTFTTLELTGNYTDKVEALNAQAYKTQWEGENLINVDVEVSVKYTIKQQAQATPGPTNLTTAAIAPTETYDNVYIRVPVEFNGKGYLINDLPVFIPAPQKAVHLDKKINGQDVTGDQKKAISSVIESFLTSYCSGNSVEISYFMADSNVKVDGLSKRYTFKRLLDGYDVKQVGPGQYFFSCQYEVTDSINNQIYKQGMEFIVVSDNSRYLIKNFDTKLNVSSLLVSKK